LLFFEERHDYLLQRFMLLVGARRAHCVNRLRVLQQ